MNDQVDSNSDDKDSNLSNKSICYYFIWLFAENLLKYNYLLKKRPQNIIHKLEKVKEKVDLLNFVDKGFHHLY